MTTSVLTRDGNDGLGRLTLQPMTAAQEADIDALTWKVDARHRIQHAFLKLLNVAPVPDRELMLSHFALTGVALSLWRAIPLISANPRTIEEVFQNGESMFQRVLSEGRSDFQVDLSLAPWSGGYYLKNALRRLPETDLALGPDLKVQGGCIVVHGHDRDFDELNPRDPSLDRPPTKVWEILQHKLDELVERWIRHAERVRASATQPNWQHSIPGRPAPGTRDHVADVWKVSVRRTIELALLELDRCAPLIRSHHDLMSPYLALAGAAFSLWKAIDLLSSTPRFVDEVFHNAKRVAQRILDLNWLRDSDELSGCSWSSGYYLRNAWYRLNEVDASMGTLASEHDWLRVRVEAGGTPRLDFRKLQPRNLAVDTPAIEIWPVLYDKLVELTESLKAEAESRAGRPAPAAPRAASVASAPANDAGVASTRRSWRLGLIHMI